MTDNKGLFVASNSSTELLNEDEFFEGEFVSCLNFASINVSVVCSSLYKLYVIFSHDGISEDDEEIINFLDDEESKNFYKFSPKMRYFRIRLENTSTSQYSKLILQTILKSVVTYEPITSSGPTTNVIVDNFPTTQDVSGVISVSNFPLVQAVTDLNTHTLLNGIASGLIKENKRGYILTLNNQIGVNGVTASIDLTNVNQTVITVFGSISDASVLTVQFSLDGITYYDSQYSFTKSSGGDLGFAISASPGYIRIKSSADVLTSLFLSVN